MNTTRFVLRRLAGLTLTLLATSVLVFGLVHIAPGDPAAFLLRGRSVDPEVLAQIRAQYRLDDPLPAQYAHWLGGALQGDFGRSVQFRQDVAGLITSRLPTTLFLTGYATVLSLVAGLAFGTLGALRPGLADRAVVIASTVSSAMPGFIAAIVLTGVFAVGLGWFPVFGPGEGFTGRLWHLTLPALALALSITGLLARITRTSMLTELGREHVEVARARGLPEARVVRRHVLRNALPPVMTVTGLVVAGLVVATAVVEVAFGLPGVGSLLVESVTAKDLPVIQAVSLLAVLAFVVANTVVDLLAPLVDPRLRERRRTARRQEVTA
ncbi:MULTISPECIES: ABC transporter permease [unclassified Streptomyces]|uniref:ABC transporter permease n=1 Tax=unclassified Streptomyces TaxID=2593676 RepID=UPI0035DC47B1